MDYINISETFLTYWPSVLVAFFGTIAGSHWINHLYKNELQSDLLTFPNQLEQRARFRKPLLFLLLMFCFSKAWSLASGLQFAFLWTAVALLSLVTVTDFEQYVIFDVMLLPFAVCGIAYTVYMQLPFAEHLAAGLGGGLLFFVLAVLTKGSIGGGDIKLIAALGLWLGVRSLIALIAYGFVAGGAAALFLLVTKQKSRHDYFAYGPYFALSGIGILLCLLNVSL